MMKFQSVTIVGVITLVIVLVGVFYFLNKPTNTEDGESSITPTQKAQEKTATKTPIEGINEYQGTLLAGDSAPLLDFTKEDYDKAAKTDKLVVLYFFANWCPICKEEFPKMQEAFDKLTTDQVVGFRVNYNDDQTDDNEVALASKFGIAYQHTKVFVKNGEQVFKSPEEWQKERYPEEINKFVN